MNTSAPAPVLVQATDVPAAPATRPVKVKVKAAASAPVKKAVKAVAPAPAQTGSPRVAKSAVKKAVPAPAAPVLKKSADSDTKPAKPKTAKDAPQRAPKMKVKMVRDSFTFPAAEHKRLVDLKKRLIALGTEVKKGELVRAGLALLAALDNPKLLKAVAGVEKLKTGRPTK